MSAQAATRPANPAELRAHQRVALEVAVNLESENNFYAGITDNISEGGVFVATLTPPPRGAKVELDLVLPTSTAPIEIKGVVCWIREHAASIEGAPAGCGIQFVVLGPEALQQIQQFIKRRETILFDVD